MNIRKFFNQISVLLMPILGFLLSLTAYFVCVSKNIYFQAAGISVLQPQDSS